MRIGHASIDENGKAKNGKAGDQTGKEVCIRSWYSKPWDYVLRCKDYKKAELMAKSCEDACNNKHIGYDQYQRNTLRTQAKSVNWDLSKITTDCETDCSAFMSVCAEASGIRIPYNGNNAPTTRTMRDAFTSTAMFDVLVGTKYTTTDKYLKRGDILVKAGSHTVMVLDDGELANQPKPLCKKGVDVSACQNKIDWEKVKNDGITFAILRSTLKNGSVDTSFEYNYKECIKHGLDVSCYKYSYAETEALAIEEAKGVVKLLGTRNIMIWLDLEDSKQLSHIGKAGITTIAKAFIKTCEKAGFKVGIYCNLNWYKNYIDESLKKYPVWIARYGKNDGKLDEKYRPKVNETIWQYTSVGKVDGISTNVDLNVK